jgi:hypothetical protein
MKNYIKTITLLLLSSIFISSSCKKNTPAPAEEQLPPETQIGAFTIGFKVDGVTYTAKGKGGLLANQHMYYSYTSDSIFNVSAGSIDNKKFNIDIDFKGKFLNYESPLSVSPFKATFYDNFEGTVPGNSNTYYTNLNNTGKVIVKYFNGTFYPGNSGTIVSGIFQFDAINSNGKIIRITDGRFDLGR